MEDTVHSLSATSVPMTNLDVVRSWKDPRYRRSLSAQQLQMLPQHPAGSVMLTGQEFKAASGLMLEEDEFAVSPMSTALTFHHLKSCGCE